MGCQTDSGMSISPEEMKSLDHQPHRMPNFRFLTSSPSHIRQCKCKESPASELSNQMSGYQSGYHSDDTDTPIYANVEMIRKRSIQKKPLPPKIADKFSVEVRYSAPPPLVFIP